MAKTTKDAATAVEETSTAVATVAAAGLPAFLSDRVKEDAGKGNSTAAADNIIPRISLLQGLSPQVNRQNKGEYIDGAEPGDFWLRVSTPAIVKGDDGFDFQPVYTEQYIAEWVPRARGGGLVAKHEVKGLEIKDSVPTAQEKPHPTNPERTIWVTPEGNELVDTREVAGFARLADGSVMPYVLTATGTNHTPFKQWQTLRNTKQVGGTPAPSWSCFYHVKSKGKQRNNHSWSVYNFSDAGWVSSLEEYERGAKLHEAFAGGQVAAETLSRDAGGEGASAPIDNNGAM